MAKASELYPVITGNGMDLSPENYTFQVEAMSAEKLPVILTAVFSIGHRFDGGRQRQKQRRRRRRRQTQRHQIQTAQPSKNHVKELIHGIVEGMTREEVFKGTEEYKEEVSQKVQLQLNHLGLFIYDVVVQYQTKVQEANWELYNKQKAVEAVLSQIDKETAPHETSANSAGDDAVDGLTLVMKDVGLQQLPSSTNPARDSDKSESSYSDMDEEAKNNSLTAACAYTGFWKNLPAVSDESDSSGSQDGEEDKMQELRAKKDVVDWNKATTTAANGSLRFWTASCFSYSDESDSSYSDEEFMAEDNCIKAVCISTTSPAGPAGMGVRFWTGPGPPYSDESDSSE